VVLVRFTLLLLGCSGFDFPLFETGGGVTLMVKQYCGLKYQCGETFP
jgi:hypothetical protein